MLDLDPVPDPDEMNVDPQPCSAGPVVREAILYYRRLVETGFCQRGLGQSQTNEQHRHFNEQPMSELHGEVDSIQTSSKLLFASQQ